MKRNMSLIQHLLEFVESKDSVRADSPPQVCGQSMAEVHYHAGLCIEAGFVVGKQHDAHGYVYPQYTLSRLTWHGHTALEELRGNSS